MTDTPDAISNDDLHAFVDGRLDDDRRREVEAHLAENPEAGARVDAYRAQNKALHDIFDPVLDEPLPRRLRPPVASLRTIHAAWAAASVILMLISGVAGWHAGGAVRPGVAAATDFARQAAIAHAVFTPQRRHPVEVAADEEAHLVKWLSKVLGQTLKAPRLGALGYALIGGRLLSAADGPAAQFMYEDSDGRRLTLYVVTDPALTEKTAFRYAEEDGVAVFYWIEKPLGYALAAKIARPELLRIARAVYDQLGR